MEFRPCIDIHNGKVKQIVGGSLRDGEYPPEENFVSGQDAAFFAEFYKRSGLKGGHVIVLNPVSGAYYEESRRQALEALHAYPGGLQLGGGITAENAEEYLNAGASHVIVTSYVFRDGRIDYDNLRKLYRAVGREKIVLDLSCRKRDSQYYIVTDRWQKYTEEELNRDILEELSGYCGEFLVHAVDREGKAGGIEEAVVRLLGEWGKLPVTYAGGVHSFDDLYRLKELGRGRVNVTIGSALKLFGGTMELSAVLDFIKRANKTLEAEEKSKKEPV